MHLDSVECSGMEYNLTDCETMNNGIIETSHSLDVGVKCQPGIHAVNTLNILPAQLTAHTVYTNPVYTAWFLKS